MRKFFLILALMALVGPVFAKPTQDTAAPLLKATTAEGEAGIWATRFLTRFHYKPTPLDDAMSEQIFDRYLNALDGDRLFFTQADIDTFAAQRDKLDDAIYEPGSGRAVRDLQPLRTARRGARRLCALATRQGLRFQRQRNLPVRPRKDAVGEGPSRGQRHLAQARQERLAAPEARQQDRQGNPQHAGQALRELSRPRAPAQQRGCVPDLHERVRDGRSSRIRIISARAPARISISR